MDSKTLAIVLALIASNGLWAFATAIYTSRSKSKRVEEKLLLGIAHDRIYFLCGEYIKQGYITEGQYDNLMYMYGPYKEMGGNGTAAKLMQEIEKLMFKTTHRTAAEVRHENAGTGGQGGH